MSAALMTLVEFRATYPEFSTADDALVQRFLDSSAGELDSDTWGEYLHTGHGLLTAHMLAISPMGEFARLQSDKGQSTYGAEYEKRRYNVTALLRVF